MKKGFSLIEMLVVMAVFMTIMLVVSDIFLSVSSSQKSSLIKQRVMVDMQYTLEQVAQMIRLGQLDYRSGSSSSPNLNQYEHLKLISSTGEKMMIGMDDSNCDSPAETCLVLIKNEVVTVLSPPSFNVTRFDFIRTPSESPYQFNQFTQKYKSDAQPQVTVLLEGVSTIETEKSIKPILLQTTISSRYYER